MLQKIAYVKIYLYKNIILVQLVRANRQIFSAGASDDDYDDNDKTCTVITVIFTKK